MTKRTADQEAKTMVTETDRNKARSAVVSTYHALDCVTIPFSFLHALADAAVDAVSADAEPDGWICENDFTLEPDLAWEWEDKGLSPKPFYFSPQQNAEPVKTAPAVAVKALQDAYSAGFAASSQGYNGEIFPDFESDNEWLGTRNGELSEILPALSAQVQDVAVPEAKTENKVEPDRSKFPYVWEGPKPDEAIIHQVINAYMGAQDREYDIDQFRYYKANWHWHYTINQHMKAAVDAASPASKHGDEE